MDLAVGDQRVDDPARVVDGDHPLERDATGLGVDLDHGQVGAERERRLAGGEVDLGAQLGQPSLLRHAGGQIAPGQGRLGRPGDVEARRGSRSSTMSSGLASSSSAASRLACSTTSSEAWPAATPPIWVDFEP